MPGMESAALQGSNRLETSKHPDHAVVLAGVRNGVYVGTGAHGRKRGIGTSPAHKSVADWILAHRETSFLTQSFQPGASLQISGAKNNSRNRRRFRIGNRGECFNLRG